MSNEVHQVHSQDGHGIYPLQVWKATLTADASGDASAESIAVSGKVVSIVVKAATLKQDATLKGYEAEGLLAAANRKAFLSLTGAGAAINTHGLGPAILVGDAAGANIAANYAPVYVQGALELVLAGANEAEVVDVWVYIDGGAVSGA